jgi:hypothetical protein
VVFKAISRPRAAMPSGVLKKAPIALTTSP